MRIESNRRTVERLKNGYLQPNRLVLRFTLTIYCYDLDFIVPLNCFVNDRCILDHPITNFSVEINQRLTPHRAAMEERRKTFTFYQRDRSS